MDSESSEFITPSVERRRHRRAQLIADVRCQALGHSEVLVTRDISPGGVFITTKKPLPLQAEVTLTLRLDPKGPALTFHGHVVNSLKGLGMGVEFTEMSDEARSMLQKFVDEAD